MEPGTTIKRTINIKGKDVEATMGRKPGGGYFCHIATQTAGQRGIMSQFSNVSFMDATAKVIAVMHRLPELQGVSMI